MSSLYPYSFLLHIGFDDIQIPASRYLYKFENHRSEIAHLKHHEKDFLFRVLKVLADSKGFRVYDLFHIEEAKEFLFDWVILTHANQKMVFDGFVSGPERLLTPKEIRRNKRFFYEYLSVWKNQVQRGRGAYCSIIKSEVNKKIKDWQERVVNNGFCSNMLNKKIELIYALFFHIYYRVKLYFDEKAKPFIVKRIGEHDVVFNVFSYVHILSRHYYPNMNKEIGISLNTEIECLDLDYLPDSIMSMIEQSNGSCPLCFKTQYLLYSYGEDYYILWIKYKRLNETRRDGFEVRSFYKCEKKEDLDKIKEARDSIVEIVKP